MRSRILVVEDDPRIPPLLHRCLGNDFEVTVTSAGSEALELIRANPPDLLLLDLSLPDMSGWDVLERARVEPFDSKVVILTGDLSAEAEKRAFLNGVDDYIVKPFNVLALSARLAQANRSTNGRKL